MRIGARRAFTITALLSVVLGVASPDGSAVRSVALGLAVVAFVAGIVWVGATVLGRRHTTTP